MNLPKCSLALALLALLHTQPVAAQGPDRLQYSIAPPFGTAQSTTDFGYSVAADGGYIVVGVPYDQLGGVVKIFNPATGALLFVLRNPGDNSGNYFGTSVAISGTRVVVGSTSPVAAHVYDLGSATPTVPLFTYSIVSGTSPGEVSVAISGTRVVLGEPRYSPGAVSRVGRVYIFDLDSAAPAVPVALFENPLLPSASNTYFGRSVAISGRRVMVESYVYDLGSATPTVPVATLKRPNGTVPLFISAAISGSRVVLGESSTYVYDLDSGTPTLPIFTLNNPDPATSYNSGRPVAISGTRVVVGAYLDDTGATDAGSGYVYDLASATPTVPVVTLNNPSPAASDYFGYAVAISGARVVVGASQDDTGAMDAGSAYAYDLSSATPAVPALTLNDPSPSAGDYFGRSVGISGTRMVVGAPRESTGAAYTGSACVYDLASTTPTVPMAKLNNPSPETNDSFGISVGISGARVVVGAFYDDTGAADSGSVYLYDMGSATPSVSTHTLNNPSPAASDYFGFAAAISGTRVVVGAYQDDTGAIDAGSVYVYDLASANPTVPVAILNNPSPATSDYFGYAVAISGTRVVVGAYRDDTGAIDAGSAYVYDLSSATPTVPVATLNNPSPAVSAYFGDAVAISGTRVLVRKSTGAFIYDLASASPALSVVTGAAVGGVAISGTVFLLGGRVYDLASPTPTVPVAVLSNPSPAAGNNSAFGNSAAIDGSTAVIGAFLDDTTARDKGAAYTYTPSPYSLWKVSELGNQSAPDLGDADGDGVSNLGEYGLLRSPTMPNGAATTAAPALYPEGSRLRMFVPRDPARDDITLEVQATGDLLGTWTTIATSTLGAPFTGPGYFGGDAATPGVKSVELRDTVNITDAPQRYLRVRVRH